MSLTAGERKEKGLTLARKEHQCQACFQGIVPGELYKRYQCTPWEADNDGFGTIVVCRFCDSQESCWHKEDGSVVPSQEHRAYCRDQWAEVVSGELNLWVEFEPHGDEYDATILDRLAIAKVPAGPSHDSWSRLELRLLPAGRHLGWYKAGEYGWRQPVRVDDAWGYEPLTTLEHAMEVCLMAFPGAWFYTTNEKKAEALHG